MSDERKNEMTVIPEPHYIPGYTGYCPQINQQVGKSFGRATYSALAHFKSSTKPIIPTTQPKPKHIGVVPPDDKITLFGQGKDLDIVRERMATEPCPVLNDYMVCGYTGHVPRTQNCIGKNFRRCCIEGIAEFDRMQKKERDSS